MTSNKYIRIQIKMRRREVSRLYDERFSKAWKGLKSALAEPIVPYLEKTVSWLDKLLKRLWK